MALVVVRTSTNLRPHHPSASPLTVPCRPTSPCSCLRRSPRAPALLPRLLRLRLNPLICVILYYQYKRALYLCDIFVRRRPFVTGDTGVVLAHSARSRGGHAHSLARLVPIFEWTFLCNNTFGKLLQWLASYRLNFVQTLGHTRGKCPTVDKASRSFGVLSILTTSVLSPSPRLHVQERRLPSCHF